MAKHLWTRTSEIRHSIPKSINKMVEMKRSNLGNQADNNEMEKEKAHKLVLTAALHPERRSLFQCWKQQHIMCFTASICAVFFDKVKFIRPWNPPPPPPPLPQPSIWTLQVELNVPKPIWESWHTHLPLLGSEGTSKWRVLCKVFSHLFHHLFQVWA